MSKCLSENVEVGNVSQVHSLRFLGCLSERVEVVL